MEQKLIQAWEQEPQDFESYAALTVMPWVIFAHTLSITLRDVRNLSHFYLPDCNTQYISNNESFIFFCEVFVMFFIPISHRLRYRCNRRNEQMQLQELGQTRLQRLGQVLQCFDFTQDTCLSTVETITSSTICFHVILCAQQCYCQEILENQRFDVLSEFFIATVFSVLYNLTRIYHQRNKQG